MDTTRFVHAYYKFIDRNIFFLGFLGPVRLVLIYFQHSIYSWSSVISLIYFLHLLRPSTGLLDFTHLIFAYLPAAVYFMDSRFVLVVLFMNSSLELIVLVGSTRNICVLSTANRYYKLN